MAWRRLSIFCLLSVFALYVITAFTTHMMGFTASDIKDSDLVNSLFLYRLAMFTIICIAWPFAIPKVIEKRFFNIRCNLENAVRLTDAESEYLTNINQHQQSMTAHYTSQNMYVKLGLMLLFIELVVIRQLNFLGV